MIFDYNIRNLASFIIHAFKMAEENNSLITRHVGIAGIIFACLLCLLVLFLQIFLFPNIIFQASERIELRITPYTKFESQINEDVGQNKLSLTSTASLPGVFSVGMRLIISETGKDGLRVREGPGKDYTTLHIAQEGAFYIIIDGPVIKDSLIWWKIQSVDEESVSGWSVQNFLSQYYTD